MGLIARLFEILFGGGRNVIAETAGIFVENAEEGARRDQLLRAAALAQFGAEFAVPRRGWFDRLIDGLNRLPRPLMAFGCIGLLVTAMVNPVWFAARMQGVALVPEPLWWLMGAIVSFYFGARSQAKSQEFQASIAHTLAQTGQVAENIRSLQALEAGAGGARGAVPSEGLLDDDPNPALDDWARGR